VGRHVAPEQSHVRLQRRPDGQLDRTEVAQRHADSARDAVEVDWTVEHLSADALRHGLGQPVVGRDVDQRFAVEVSADGEAVDEDRLTDVIRRREERQDL